MDSVWVEKDEVWWKMIPMVILALTVIVTVVLIYGSRRWESGTKEMHARLEAACLLVGTKAFGPNELVGLPAPVQKYFEAALPDGQFMISAVHLEAFGTISLSAPAEKWKRFTSMQEVITQRPGFDWEGRIEYDARSDRASA